jgi:hypothetical protein
MDFNRDLAKENGSVFTGIYRVLRVDNIFERGQFTQKLDLVRIYNDKRATTTEQQSNSELLRGQGDAVEDPETGNSLVQLSGPTEEEQNQDNADAAARQAEQTAADAEEQNARANNNTVPTLTLT